ncbi:DUF4149 domain-containing protein [Mucisphaera calidilacus]|uniref:Uncharacterized protein n=1 Tax=Mucisphaera calidilacus TaxID=2527982 RepID=A0A518BUL1_9BACT|nr:DUF4149 domain-containing protein [Mucisphaera calidilacus]QDU70656.1 hypothetical protein Pan265_04860 [Mucisphaera calidilacus]
MNTLKTLFAIQIIALGLWAGSTLMMGLGAPQIFWTMRDYQPMITAPQHYHVLLRNDDPQRLAGVIANKLFDQHAIIRYACASAAIATLLIIPWLGGKTSRTQLAILILALGCLLYEQQQVVPQMNDLYAVIYDPAKPEIDRAAARDAFHTLHKTAERTVGTEALLVLAALAVAPWAHAPKPAAQPAPQPAPADDA